MGAAAARAVAQELKQRLARQDRVRMVFAAAPSQLEFLAALVAQTDIDWSRVTAFHMDEYIGLAADSPARFSHFLDVHLFDKVKPGQVHRIRPAPDPRQCCEHYAQRLADWPLDVVCLGIGENGHLVFNDPPVADFADPLRVKIVTLDETCRQQQVNDGCFPTLASVPSQAITLTIPALLSADRLFCIVPGARKTQALQALRHAPLSTDWPATSLREHPHCVLYTDREGWGD